MSKSTTAHEIMEREFLETRAKLLELAAALDRLDRAAGSVDQDPRLQQVQRALAVLSNKGADRAEQIQLIFSLQLDPEWRSRYGLAKLPT